MDHSSELSNPSDDMASYEDCMIYVDADDREFVIEILLKSNAAHRQDAVLLCGCVKIYVAHNDYATGRSPYGFVQWSTVLECESIPGATPEGVVSAIGAILAGIWSSGTRAVAACDFEDELPTPPWGDR